MEQHLSQYKIFYEVAKAGNISKAAKELYISQPAISKAVSKLEESLNVCLFIRNSRGVQLTDEGAVLFHHVNAAFDSLSRGEQELKRIHDFHIGQIKIGVSNTLCKYMLLPYLKGFVERFPHIKVTIDSQSTAQTLMMLEQQQIDIGLIAQQRNMHGLTFSPLMKIEDIFVSTQSYLNHLKQREGQDVDIFRSGNLMLLDRNNITRTHIDSYFAENHIETNQILESTTMDLIIEFSKIGLGIGCVIKEFVEDELTDGSLIQIPLTIPIKKRTVGFAYNPNSSSRALNSFIHFCNEADNPSPL